MKVSTLDLHGVKHEHVINKVEEWVLLESSKTPAFTGRIITGNSSKMRILAEGVLVKHKFDYNYLSDGSIVVGGRL